MSYKSFISMFFIIFLWVFTLPLMFAICIICLPVGSILLTVSYIISVYVQWYYQENIIANGIMRKIFSKIPFESWFESYTVHKTPAENGIILAHPHGILCCGMVIYHFKNTKSVMAVAPILFYIPIFGWMARSCGLIPATNNMIKKALIEKYNVILYVGGIEELIAHENNELYIKKRWGYLKIIKDLKPNITIAWIQGESQTFFLPPLPFLNLRQYISKKIGFAIMFPWIFGWNSIWIPKPVPLQVNFKVLPTPDSFQLTELKKWYHSNLLQLIRQVYASESKETLHYQKFVQM